MPFNSQNIDNNFPFEEYRDGQKEAIEFITQSINKGKKYIIIEAPTGSGKSPIGITIGNMSQNAFYVTIQKFLQDQLAKDFGESGKFGHYAVNLKGRNAYQCPWYKNNAQKLLDAKAITQKTSFEWQTNTYTCDEGRCRSDGKANLKECLKTHLCPYFNQIEKAQNSQQIIMNFSSFLFQTEFTDRFPKRNVLIIDEAHNCESQLMNFVSLTLSNRNIPNLKIPKYDSAQSYAAWIQEENITQFIRTEMLQAEKNQDLKKIDKLTLLITKCEKFVEAILNRQEKWVSEYAYEDGEKKVQFKPIYVDAYAHKYLFDKADIVIFMSATILNANVFTKSLGIPKDKTAAKRMKSRFPTKHHPIYYKPIAKLTGGTKGQEKWGKLLVSTVEEITQKYPNKKGIIHTHNFSIAKLLLTECNYKTKSRFLFQKNFEDKFEMLQEHANSQNSIIVAPAMHEGLDLKNDLSRFQILCKVPFPNFYSDKQLAIRKDENPEFYNWLVALKTCQSVGRSVRHEKDYADTYIIDGSFGWWYEQNKHMIPSWFKNAIIK